MITQPLSDHGPTTSTCDQPAGSLVIYRHCWQNHRLTLLCNVFILSTVRYLPFCVNYLRIHQRAVALVRRLVPSRRTDSVGGSRILVQWRGHSIMFGGA